MDLLRIQQLIYMGNIFKYELSGACFNHLVGNIQNIHGLKILGGGHAKTIVKAARAKR